MRYAGGTSPERNDYTKGSDESTCKLCGSKIFDSDKDSHIRYAHPSTAQGMTDKHFDAVNRK